MVGRRHHPCVTQLVRCLLRDVIVANQRGCVREARRGARGDHRAPWESIPGHSHIRRMPRLRFTCRSDRTKRSPQAPAAGAPPGGVAVVSRVGGEPSLTRVVQLEGSPWGMALTQDGGLLIVASDDRVAFIDPARLIAGSADAILGYLRDAPTAGRFYANVTPDDRWLFLSDESAKAISVVDLAKARVSGFNDSAVIGQIPAGRAPIALTFSMDHQLLYTTSQVAPAAYGWPAVCSAPGSEAARQASKLRRRRHPGGRRVARDARSRQRGGRCGACRMQSGSTGRLLPAVKSPM